MKRNNIYLWPEEMDVSRGFYHSVRHPVGVVVVVLSEEEALR